MRHWVDKKYSSILIDGEKAIIRIHNLDSGKWIVSVPDAKLKGVWVPVLKKLDSQNEAKDYGFELLKRQLLFSPY